MLLSQKQLTDVLYPDMSYNPLSTYKIQAYHWRPGPTQHCVPACIEVRTCTLIDAVQVESQLAGAEHSRLILDALRLSTITADCLVSPAVAFCMKKIKVVTI